MRIKSISIFFYNYDILKDMVFPNYQSLVESGLQIFYVNIVI